MPIRISPKHPLRWTVVFTALLACSTSDGDSTAATDESASGSTSSNTSTTSTTSTTGTDAPSTGDVAPTEAAPTTTGASTDTGSDDGVDPETGSSSTGEGPSSTSEPAPTDGPGVLPGEDGMDAFCRRYIECGGTYYGDQQTCLDETYGYWGDCPSRKAALDAFGACMSEMDCGDWSPDAYNPGNTPCAQQWDEVGASDPC